MDCPKIDVGILFSPVIRFRLNGNYRDIETGKQYTGLHTVETTNGGYRFNEEDIRLPLLLEPENYTTDSFDLLDVTIGINFHWERKEDQRFKGSLKIIDEGTHLTAVNILQLEDYLLSVISSEMSANSSIELLKAHAVISRSWLLAQQAKARSLARDYNSCTTTDTEYVRWFDREDHDHFDVCADDHCQRYQGISRAYTPAVKEAILTTYGEVLCCDGQVCDARFSKCCGGVSERFDNTWEPVSHPYLTKVIDAARPVPTGDLTREEDAHQWICSKPDVFCNTTDKKILSNVLNDYDQETADFFRWSESFTQQEISDLVKLRTDFDCGTITDLIPLERGVSGRIIRLKIVGTKRTLTIGKELVIRKAFSHSHLYSSAFIIKKQNGGFIFHGAGWGHGVGLCQIGAAVMSDRGYSYREILSHYFPGAQTEKRYEPEAH